MNASQELARQFREVHFGGNWTVTNLQDSLKEIDVKTATTHIEGFNSIAKLAYHMHYFIKVVLPVLDGGSLEAHDKYSWETPDFTDESEWREFCKQYLADARNFADKLESLPENKLWDTFFDEKYGNWYRNFHGIIEHTHYHLGQIVLLQKMAGAR